MRNIKKNNRKNNSKTLLKVILPFVGIVAGGWFLFIGIARFLNTSSYFDIKKVVFVGVDKKDIADGIAKYYIGENIFQCDLRQASGDIKLKYPQFYDVGVVRNFPDRLTVYIIQREPMAQISNRGKDFFLVDRDGMIVSEGLNKPYDKFIVVSGIEGISSFSFGKKILIKELKGALQLVSVLQNNERIFTSLLKNAALDSSVEIDISKFPTLIAKINSLELRFTDDSYSQKLKMLFKILPTLTDRLQEIKYIDLRFTEPAVAFK